AGSPPPAGPRTGGAGRPEVSMTPQSSEAVGRRGGILRVVVRLATAWVVVVLVIVVAGLLVRPEAGAVALVELFAGHLALASLVVVPLAFVPHVTSLRLGCV